MKILIKREIFSDKSTIGKMFIDGSPVCYTLEDKTRPDSEKKIYGETAIPYGEYPITFRTEGSIYEDYKVRFKDIGNERGTLWIRNIPNYEYVLIHVGNFPKDTLGCILVGNCVSLDNIHDSTIAYKKIYPVIANALERGEEVIIKIVDGLHA